MGNKLVGLYDHFSGHVVSKFGFEIQLFAVVAKLCLLVVVAFFFVQFDLLNQARPL